MLQPIQKLTVQCPVRPGTLARLAAGDITALETDDLLAPVLAAIQGAALFGAIGPYRDVFHVGVGLEGFTPTAQARPTLGQAGQPCRTPLATLSLHVPADAPAAAIASALAAIAAAHPWEVPVVDLSPAVRYVPEV